MTAIIAFLNHKKSLIDSVLVQDLPPAQPGAERVREAMRYAVFSDGKRIRPILLLAVAELLGHDESPLLPAASAVEFIHTCSLILDDLPAMDDSERRRGKPSLHVAYDEATAILAAEALLLHAFALISENARRLKLGSDAALAAVGVAARAAGYPGMVAGQYLDLLSKTNAPTREQVESIHLKKTASLFTASARIAAVLCQASPEEEEALARYSACLGLAFQITDDLLDAESSECKGSGRELNYALLFGMDAARARAERLVAEALEGLEPFGQRASTLAALVRYVPERGK